MSFQNDPVLHHRLIQFIIHFLFGACLFVSALNFEWSRVSLANLLYRVFVPVVIAALPWASALLNFQLIRKRKITVSIQKNFRWPIISLFVACTIIYFAKGVRASYDSHLDFLSLTAEFPPWLWLPASIDRFAVDTISIASVPEGILTSLFTLLLMFLFLSAKGFNLVPSIIVNMKVNKVLILCHTLFGLILLVFGYWLLYGWALHCFDFLSYALQENSGVRNTHNFTSLISRFIGSLLFIVYGQWIVRDGWGLLRAK